jgi:hypothetical protein
VRPDLLLAGDLSGGDLVEQFLGAIAELRGVERQVLRPGAVLPLPRRS